MVGERCARFTCIEGSTKNSVETNDRITILLYLLLLLLFLNKVRGWATLRLTVRPWDCSVTFFSIHSYFFSPQDSIYLITLTALMLTVSYSLQKLHISRSFNYLHPFHAFLIHKTFYIIYAYVCGQHHWRLKEKQHHMTYTYIWLKALEKKKKTYANELAPRGS